MEISLTQGVLVWIGGYHPNCCQLATIAPLSGALKMKQDNLIGQIDFLLAKFIYDWCQIGILSSIITYFFLT
jgi:hypothetical protein